MAAEPSVSVLLARASAGDAAAWEAIVDRFAPLVWAVTRSQGLDHRDATDVSQTVWLRVVEHLGALREPEAFPGWLRTTTRHECLRTRRRGANGPLPLDWDLLHGMADDARADDAALAAERSEVVGDALARLSERCRSLLRVFAFSPDAGYTEIAASLGMPVGSIGPTRQRCLGHLRRRLESVGYLSEAAG
jgi:RNA polymerase sigma factor (sigma-70 family)